MPVVIREKGDWKNGKINQESIEFIDQKKSDKNNYNPVQIRAFVVAFPQWRFLKHQLFKF